MLRRGRVGSDRPRIGVSVREWQDRQEFKEVMSSAIDKFAAAHKAEVVFLPLQHPGDVTASEQVASFMGSRHIITERTAVPPPWLCTGRWI